MQVASKQRVRVSGFAGVVGLTSVAALAACGHDASLGLQCALDDPSCISAAGSGEPAPAPRVEDAGPTRGCKSVSMAYFGCASAQEMPGVPQLRAGRSYTFRVRGDYAIDTTFRLKGAAASCLGAMPMETVTLAAGAAEVERCITPSEDIALLLAVVSGDPMVWSGFMAEVCDGCE